MNISASVKQLAIGMVEKIVPPKKRTIFFLPEDSVFGDSGVTEGESAGEAAAQIEMSQVSKH